MRILDKYVFKELIAPLIFGMSAFSSILVAGSILPEITRYLIDGAPVWLVIKIFIYSIPTWLGWTFPMSVLLGTLMGFGRLSGESEIVAMYAGGISFSRIIRSAIYIGITVSLIALLFGEYVIPASIDAGLALRSQLKDANVSGAFSIDEIENGKVKRSVAWTSFNPVKNTMNNVTLLEFTDGKPVILIHAKSAHYEGDIKGVTKWEFQQGYMMGVTPKDQMTLQFDDKGVILNRTPRDITNKQEGRKPEELSYAELSRRINRMKKEGDDAHEIRKESIQLSQKLSIPFVSLIFALIGAPLGLRPHRGSSAIGLGLSIVIIFVYYTFASYVKVIGEGGTLSPFLASWLPNFIGGAVGIGLIVKASR